MRSRHVLLQLSQSFFRYVAYVVCFTHHLPTHDAVENMSLIIYLLTIQSARRAPQDGRDLVIEKIKYVRWRCALVYERLRCELWMEGDYRPAGLEGPRAAGGWDIER